MAGKLMYGDIDIAEKGLVESEDGEETRKESAFANSKQYRRWFEQMIDNLNA